MSKAIVNALTLALMDAGSELDAPNVASARAFAERFVADNAELFEAVPRIGPGLIPRTGPVTPIPECPNCHQPVNDHMPNCARATGIDPRAVTAKHHLRVDGPPPMEE